MNFEYMKLYHGTDAMNIRKFRIIKRDGIDKCHGYSDLGDGVYFTSNFEQAKKWAGYKAKKCCVYEIEFEDKKLNVKHFEECDDELYWLFALSRINLENCVSEFIDEYKLIDCIDTNVLVKNVKSFDRLANLFIQGKELNDDEIYDEISLNKLEKDNIKYKLIRNTQKKYNPITIDELKEIIKTEKKEYNQYCFKSKKSIKYINDNLNKKYIIYNGKIQKIIDY